jgi:heme exporter protein B
LSPLTDVARTCAWLVHKDLLRELRAPRVWPAMLLLGLVLALALAMQIDLPLDQERKVIGALFWLAVFFAWNVALDRAFAGEREENCWQALLLYPVTPGSLFLAKFIANFLALVTIEAVLIPAFFILADVSLLANAWPFLAILVAANLGLCAVGTLVSALISGLSRHGSLLVLLVLPLVSPVVIGAGQATASLLTGDLTSWKGWLQLLSVFAALFMCLGMLLFEFVIEE